MENIETVDTNVTQETTETQEQPDYKKLYEEAVKEKDKFKTSFDKASSETAEYKRKLSEHLTAEEQAKMEREQAEKEMREELEQLRAEKRVGNYNAKLLTVGIGAEEADALAKLLPDGVPNEFFDGIKTFIENVTAQIRADALKKQPTLTTGNPVQVSTAEDAEKAKMRSWMGL
jgi:hypothetical protein